MLARHFEGKQIKIKYISIQTYTFECTKTFENGNFKNLESFFLLRENNCMYHTVIRSKTREHFELNILNGKSQLHFLTFKRKELPATAHK